MRSIRILVPLHVMPTEKHITTILFENLLPVLKTKINVEMIWLVYLPAKINISQIPTNLGTILDIHNFKNFVEVIKNVNPDIIYENEDRGVIDLACKLTANQLDIPIIVPINNSSIKSNFSKHYQFNHILNIIRTFFRKEISSSEKSQHQKLFKGSFYLFKFIFLLKTMNILNLNFIKQLKIFYQVFKSTLSEKPLIYSYSPNNLYRLESPTLIDPLIKLGFKKSNLYVTGNPMYDQAFKKLKSNKIKKNSDKIRVLMAPLQLYENGLWSKNHQDYTIKKTISEICTDFGILLTIKLHPSSVNFLDYENLIHDIDSNLKIFQSGDIIDYLINTDVVVSFPGDSTMFIYALALGKPLILCNFFDQTRHQFLEKNLALECTNPKFITDQIKSAITNNQISIESVEKFLKENFYKTDGQASERLSDAIIDFLIKQKKLN